MTMLRSAAVCAMAVLAQAGVSAGLTPAQSAEVRAARPAETVVLELPAGVALRKVEGEALTLGADRELRADGPTTIELSDGVRLTTRRARVTLALDGSNGPRRVLVEPLAGAAIELSAPAGTLRSVTGAAPPDPRHSPPIVWYGKPTDGRVDVALVDGVWLFARYSRVTIQTAVRDRSVRIFVAPLHTAPAET